MPASLFINKSTLPVTLQREVAECGLACLTMILCYYGHGISLYELRKKFDVSAKGVTLSTLVQVAEKSGLNSRAIKIELEELKLLNKPCILHWDLNHFVVLKDVKKDRVIIHDPANGKCIMPFSEVSKHFTGIVLELSPAINFTKKKNPPKLKLSSIWSGIRGFKRATLQLLFLSTALQIFAIVAPFYSQIIVDEVLVKYDVQLLFLLAFSFGLFAVVGALTEALRNYVVLHMGTLVSYHLISNLFNHLIHLPHTFFSKRHVGDIVSKFHSTQKVRQMLTEGIVAVIIDGMMAVLTFLMMLWYSPLLSFLVISSLAIVLIARISFYEKLKYQAEQEIITQADCDTNFIENVRGVLSIKLSGREAERVLLWQKLFSMNLNRTVNFRKSKILLQTVNNMTSAVENIIVLFIAAKLVLSGSFSIGMLFAFLTYKKHFVDKSIGLIERSVEFKMLDLHMERIADVALEEREQHDKITSLSKYLEGRIEFRNVWFRYGEGEPYIIKGMNLIIEPGENVAITGVSGCGKSTLISLLLGLLYPERGEIYIDDEPMGRYGIQCFRSQVGVVMQDDKLFSGTLLQNIAFCDPDPDMEKVSACARLAAVDADIRSMPMQYNTLVGDMGTALSGGQIQRILLARALYRSPRMLILDEGTAHLDKETELLVNTAVRGLNITRIIIAHRVETIASVERVLTLFDGKVSDKRFDYMARSLA